MQSNKVQISNCQYVKKKNPVNDCPLTAALTVFGGKWKLIIVYWLNNSHKNFAGLHELIPGISNKVLGQHLKELVSDGILNRTVTGKPPSPVIYSLTDYGKTLLPIVENIKVWGRKHIEVNE